MESAALPEFQKFLISKKLAPNKHVSFYAYWASLFLSFAKNHSFPDTKTGIQQFLEHLNLNAHKKD